MNAYKQQNRFCCGYFLLPVAQLNRTEIFVQMTSSIYTIVYHCLLNKKKLVPLRTQTLRNTVQRSMNVCELTMHKVCL